MTDAPENGWRDIETAPKDGTWILLYAPNLPPQLQESVDLTHWIASWGLSRDDFGWIDQDDRIVVWNEDPTHWQFLPEPPK